MKELITAAGKKAYTLVMGKPNPAKLANFPEVSFTMCRQILVVIITSMSNARVTKFTEFFIQNDVATNGASYLLIVQSLS